MKPRKPIDLKAVAKRQALNALRRARRTADRAGIELTDWEGEFLGSVEDRLKTYGRAFADQEKGAPGQALSTLQRMKLKQIAAKAKGEEKLPARRKGFRRNTRDEDRG
ncbi:hypothetical protein [Phenylobacterium immobile]|uniref:hypothetical protein n=1 Tax=Phenylobacterium immobile TaxID=21 RepID=UPI000A44D780|nr:hypothetical protein [Phenylobacterium immobile]